MTLLLLFLSVKSVSTDRLLFLSCCSCPSKILDRQNDVVEVVGQKLLVLVGRKLLNQHDDVVVVLVHQKHLNQQIDVFVVVIIHQKMLD